MLSWIMDHDIAIAPAVLFSLLIIVGLFVLLPLIFTIDVSSKSLENQWSK